MEQFESATYGKSITVRVLLPAGYAETAPADRKYPTLYMLDGQTLFDECTAFRGEHELQLDETVSKLVSEGTIPAMIVVGIDSTDRRNHEYSAYGNPLTAPNQPDPIGKQLPAFFAQELLPWVKNRYRVTDDAAEAGIGGASLGATAALYISLQRPDLFGLALLQSPSLMLGNGQFLRDTASLARAPDRVAIGVGAAEFDFPDVDLYFGRYRLSRSEAEPGIVEMTEVLAANLKAAYIKRSAVMLTVAPNARHDSASWAARMPDAVAFLFAQRQ